MKKAALVSLLILMTCTTFSQFNDTSSLNSYIRSNIKDKRPEKVSAEQIQKALLGLSSFLYLGSSGGGVRPADKKDTVYTFLGWEDSITIYSELSYDPATVSVTSVEVTNTKDEAGKRFQAVYKPALKAYTLFFPFIPLAGASYKYQFSFTQ